MVQNVWDKISENLGFVENNNFISESTNAAVSECSGVNSQKIPMALSCYSNVTGLNSKLCHNRILPKVFPCETAFLQNTSERLEVLRENILKSI